MYSILYVSYIYETQWDVFGVLLSNCEVCCVHTVWCAAVTLWGVLCSHCVVCCVHTVRCAVFTLCGVLCLHCAVWCIRTVRCATFTLCGVLYSLCEVWCVHTVRCDVFTLCGVMCDHLKRVINQESNKKASSHNYYKYRDALKSNHIQICFYIIL